MHGFKQLLPGAQRTVAEVRKVTGIPVRETTKVPQPQPQPRLGAAGLVPPAESRDPGRPRQAGRAAEARPCERREAPGAASRGNGRAGSLPPVPFPGLFEPSKPAQGRPPPLRRTRGRTLRVLGQGLRFGVLPYLRAPRVIRRYTQREGLDQAPGPVAAT